MAWLGGIDLGTTNSVVAVMEGGDPTVITTAEGSRLCPSVVPFHKNGDRAGGGAAERQGGGGRERARGDQRGEHDLLHQALHGPPPRRGIRRAQDGPVRGRERLQRR